MDDRVLTALILVPLAGAAAAVILGRWRDAAARWVALICCLLILGLTASVWIDHRGGDQGANAVLEQRIAWIPSFGIEYHLALDGLSLVFVALTGCLGLVAVLASWREITRAVGAHYMCILATLAGILGVFLAYDMFLFYFFWELMLVPMYFLIGVWGHERRVGAAVKFVIFTMVSGLLLLVAIIGLYAAHGAATGVYTMDYTRLLGTQLPLSMARWLFLGFLVAFAVKLPMFPLHTWLPDAHGEAPTAGSILLAGLLLKTGGYGLIRFAVPLFPEAAASFAAPLAALGVIGILYGAVLAFAQSDLKRLIAYSSVSHMGFVMLAVAAWRFTSLQGAVAQMLAHGLATGALFAIAGMLHERLHTRAFADLGGLWAKVPALGAFSLLFVLASVGLPGMGNFIGEFLVLLGSFPVSPNLTVVATAGIVIGTVAMLALMQRTFFGPAPANHTSASLDDLSLREVVVVAVLAVAVLGLGVLPQPVLDATAAPLTRLLAEEVQFNPIDPEMSPGDRRTAVVRDGLTHRLYLLVATRPSRSRTADDDRVVAFTALNPKASCSSAGATVPGSRLLRGATGLARLNRNQQLRTGAQSHEPS